MKKIYCEPEIKVVEMAKFMVDEVISQGEDTNDFTNSNNVFEDESSNKSPIWDTEE